MSGETVRIVLVCGPLDGETHPIPEAEARSGIARRYVPPFAPLGAASMWRPDGIIPEPPKHLEYRPMTVDFAGRPMPSITDDGTRRYKFAGER